MKVYENLSLENLEGEIWKDVVGYEGYQVSNLGRVKSLDKRVNVSGFLKYPTTKIRKGKILRQSKDKDGYLKVALFKDTEKKYLRVHRIVAMTFIPNPENKKTVDHKNTIVDDNRVENLSWMTHKQQLNDNELSRERHLEAWRKNRKCIKKRVRCITTGKEFDSIKEAGDYYNIKHNEMITRCCKGKQEYTGKISRQKLQWEYID
jgi:hypothetical protein